MVRRLRSTTDGTKRPSLSTTSDDAADLVKTTFCFVIRVGHIVTKTVRFPVIDRQCHSNTPTVFQKERDSTLNPSLFNYHLSLIGRGNRPIGLMGRFSLKTDA